MPHDIDAIYDQGVFRPLEPLVLPQGTRVHLHVEPEAAPSGDVKDTHPASSKTLAERFKNIIGAAKNLPEDMAENHDHYLHGTPKQ